jgi:Na+/H+ antiporter NhaD/arsenite permease-like protein
MRLNLWGLAAAMASLALPARAATQHGAIHPLWGLPFAGLLVTVAVLPLLAPRFWHHRMGLVVAGWVLALLVPQLWQLGPGAVAGAAWHAILLEYLPFVMLLLALFTAGGGILLEGGPWGTPVGNTVLLALGTALAGVMGTTGVSMVLIHPLLRANAHRRRRVHLVVFFILLCGNAGGATSPLGDPPLYLGFLHGVPFQWPLLNLGLPLALLAAPLLGGFYLLDRRLARGNPPPARDARLRLQGRWNVGLIGLTVACVLAQGVWHPGDVVLLGQAIGLERVAGMLVFAAITLVSLKVTPAPVRERNMFSWAPMAEVGKLFAGIFITIGPVLALLQAGPDGPFAGLLRLTADASGVPEPLAYFWFTGLLSAFLDNAPTYLVFFQLAGDDVAQLTGGLNHVLTALASGAVFFGALTYVGNAPNMMIRSIAAHRGIEMPGFFGYIAWASALLLPSLLLLSAYFVVWRS